MVGRPSHTVRSQGLRSCARVAGAVALVLLGGACGRDGPLEAERRIVECSLERGRPIPPGSPSLGAYVRNCLEQPPIIGPIIGPIPPGTPVDSVIPRP